MGVFPLCPLTHLVQGKKQTNKKNRGIQGRRPQSQGSRLSEGQRGWLEVAEGTPSPWRPR